MLTEFKAVVLDAEMLRESPGKELGAGGAFSCLANSLLQNKC